jgi:succinate-semialdehyde dehydrogenase / glutarate-semialdehyde dehydrogenase
LLRWAEAIEASAGDIASKLSIDTGRQHIANIEVLSIVGTLRRWAATGPAIIAALDKQNEPSATPGVVISNRHVPYTLLGVIALWNFPLLLALIDAIPALLAGWAAANICGPLCWWMSPPIWQSFPKRLSAR